MKAPLPPDNPLPPPLPPTPDQVIIRKDYDPKGKVIYKNTLQHTRTAHISLHPLTFHLIFQPLSLCLPRPSLMSISSLPSLVRGSKPVRCRSTCASACWTPAGWSSVTAASESVRSRRRCTLPVWTLRAA